MDAKIHKIKIAFNYEEVAYLAADINYTKIFFANGPMQLIPYTIKQFELYLSNNQDFIRIHRGFIINQNYLKEISEFEVVMCCGKRLPIARRRKFAENHNTTTNTKIS